MNPTVAVRVPPRSLTLGLGCLALCVGLLTSGCGSRPSGTDSAKVPDREVSTAVRPLSSKSGDPRARIRTGSGKTLEEQKFEAAQKKEQEITSQLEQANAMLKGSNLEGALRQVLRVAQENAQDPYVTMRTAYLEAMIYHRMKDGPKRKDAMNRLLKDMETLQGDPRFQQGFLDGMANQEIIKMSLDQAGKHYGN